MTLSDWGDCVTELCGEVNADTPQSPSPQTAASPFRTQADSILFFSGAGFLGKLLFGGDKGPFTVGV